MLVIKVTNTREVMRKHIGPFKERLISRVVDHEALVEKYLIQELEASFKSFGIEARIYSVEDADVVDDRLRVPLKVREQRAVGTGPSKP